MPHKPQRSWRAYFKKRGLTLPGYNYLGPFNSLDNGEPTNKSDRAARKHDWKYKDIQDKGLNPYTSYNKADEEFIKEVGWDVGGVLGYGAFQLKRGAAAAGLIDDIRNHKKLKPFDNSLETATMSDDGPNPNAGSGNGMGLRETPIDDPYNVHRGPPDYTFASLPFTADYLVSDINPVYVRDHVFRMTSPYDPNNSLSTFDDNTGGGFANRVTAGVDAADIDIRSARWWEYYSGMYTYYHVVGCRYTISIENFGEPIWVYFMNYNDDIPNPQASNEHMQLWRDCEYHYLGSSYLGLNSEGGRAVGYLGKLDNAVNPTENDTNMIPSGDNPSANSLFVTGNNIQNPNGSSFLVKRGEYRPGDFRREIRLDSQVENWTLCTTNPSLPEKLLIRFKPQSNVRETNSVRSSGDSMQFRMRVHLNYLVEFKELKEGLRYPVVDQPLIVTINTAQTSRP